MSNKTSYTNKYISSHYDRVNLTLPKGVKEKVRSRADELSMSINTYINALITHELEYKTLDNANHKKANDVIDIHLL